MDFGWLPGIGHKALFEATTVRSMFHVPRSKVKKPRKSSVYTVGCRIRYQRIVLHGNSETQRKDESKMRVCAKLEDRE